MKEVKSNHFKQYVYLMQRMSSLFLSDRIIDKERKNIIETLLHWLQNRQRSYETLADVKIGDVYLFSFGLNSLPTMAYYHMGIVIAKTKKYLYVLPITFYNDKFHKNAYHHTLKNEYINEYHLMKSEDFVFLEHDSVVKTMDIRCVSGLDIIGEKLGNVDSHSQFFLDIYEVGFATIFCDYRYQLYKMNNVFKKQLEEELLCENITIQKGEKFELNRFLRDVHGKVSNIDKLNFDTTTEGIYTYLLEITDEFGNCIQKQLRLRVIDLNKNKNDIEDEIYNE